MGARVVEKLDWGEDYERHKNSDMASRSFSGVAIYRSGQSSILSLASAEATPRETSIAIEDQCRCEQNTKKIKSPLSYGRLIDSQEGWVHMVAYSSSLA